MDEIPEIYRKIAIKYPCSAEDLYNAAGLYDDPEIIELAAEMMGAGLLWWQVRAAFSLEKIRDGK